MEIGPKRDMFGILSYKDGDLRKFFIKECKKHMWTWSSEVRRGMPTWANPTWSNFLVVRFHLTFGTNNSSWIWGHFGRHFS